MKPIALLVLDMAGTTVNENNVVYKTVRKALANNGFDLPLDMVLELGAGKEKAQAIRDILRSMGLEGNHLSETTNEVFSDFQPLLKNAYKNLNVKTFPGVLDLFTAARANNVQVVLNTGYDTETAIGLVRKLGWKPGITINGIVTADMVKNGRPAPDMIYEAMKICQVTDPETVLKAGDSAIDILEGKNAQCGVTVGVLSGAQTRDQLKAANPDYIVNSVADLQGLLFG